MFNSNGIADHLITMLEALPGMNLVQKGVAESQSKNFCAYVTIGSQNKTRKATGTTSRKARFLITFSYLVKGGEDTAEATLMTAIDTFIAAVDADLTLGSLVQDTELDLGLADSADYAPFAGRESRVYPVVVEVTEQGTYNVNP